MVRHVRTEEAPSFEELGLPISQATIHDESVYVSGQVGLDPETNSMVDGGIREQTKQTMRNIEAILDAAGTSIDDIIKTTVFVEDMDDFEAVNDVYAEFVSEPYPARSAVEVGELAMEFDVEIEVIAAL